MDKNRPRILVVDDQEQNRLLVTEFLEMLDVSVDEASSGRECLNKLKEQDYLLVILDVQMPDLDGFSVLELMHEDKKLAEIPVVFVSAVFDSEEYILKGIEKGAIDFIIKPINTSILKTKVQNFIKLYEKQQALDQLVKSLETINKRLHDSEKKLKKITQSANDAIILLDKDFNVKFWNRASNQIFGYSRFEMLYENFFNYVIADQSKDLLKEVIGTLGAGNGKSRQNSIQIAGRNKNGTEFPIELSLASFTATSGETNYTVVIRDITKRVLMEKEALKAKELQETNRVMKEFMDSVSHELRTPMNAILGISNMLTKYGADNLTLKQREGLEIISQSGVRLLDLINDILDLSRLDANRVSVDSEPIELEKFLATMHSMVLSLIGEKDIKFHIRKSSGVPDIIYSDIKKLSQILTNLLGNSAKFTKKGRIVLYIHFLENKLYFEISDTGIGIAEEHLDTIFERFQQIDNSQTKEYKGTGLGLNICRKLILLMGGEIRAESEPGKGTIMKFYLPLQKSVVALSSSDNLEKSKNKNLKSIEQIELEAPLSIIIQDDKDHHYWYSNLMKTKGIESLPYSTSKEALHAISQFLPDLILLKIEMPKIHGASIISEISKINMVNDIPIIAFSQIRELAVRNISNPLILLEEPADAEMIFKAVDQLNIRHRKHHQSNLILFEKDNRLKDMTGLNDEIFYNTSLAFSKIIIARRNIENLILDGIDIDGENFKLVRWLLSESNYQPQKVIVVTANRPFDLILEELKKLPDYRILNIQDVRKMESIKEWINSTEKSTAFIDKTQNTDLNGNQ